MIEILNLGPNEYKNWVSYQDEYIIQSFAGNSLVNHKVWGRFREGYIPGLNISQIIDHLYNGGVCPDLIIIPASIFIHKDYDDRKIFETLENISKRTVIAFTLSDPWRFNELIIKLTEKYTPKFWFFYFKDIVDQYNASVFSSTSTKAYVLPICVGRRYFNMGMERDIDIGLIGRCEIDGSPLTARQIKRVKRSLAILDEPTLSKLRNKLNKKKYANQWPELILNLNRCLTSWNGAVTPKGKQGVYVTPTRFVEAAACGAISIVPFDFKELNEYYFPKDSYITVNNSIQKTCDNIAELRSDSKLYHRISNRAYKLVMGNHQAENRVMFILDLLQGKESADARDYYKFSLSSG